MRILVCGGRDYEDIDKVFEILDSYHQIYHVNCLIQGHQRTKRTEENREKTGRGYDYGADYLALTWAKSRGVPHDDYPANWNKYGNSAGHIRNQQMIDEGRPDMVIAFPGNVGTADMVRRADKADIPVVDLRWIKKKL